MRMRQDPQAQKCAPKLFGNLLYLVKTHHEHAGEQQCGLFATCARGHSLAGVGRAGHKMPQKVARASQQCAALNAGSTHRGGGVPPLPPSGRVGPPGPHYGSSFQIFH